MKPLVRYTALFLSILFLSGVGLAWFEVLTHENIFNDPQLKSASGWLMMRLMLLALGLKGLRLQRRQPKSLETLGPTNR